MAKRRTKKKKPTITEQRRKNLLRAMKRTYGAYSPGAFELVQKASPQKIRSLAKNRNKNLHKLSYYENPATAAQTTEKELQKLYKRLEKQNKPEDQSARDQEEADRLQYITNKIKGVFGGASTGEEAEEDFEYYDAVKMGDVMLANIYDWIDSQGTKGKGETGIHAKETIDELIKEYGEDTFLAAIGQLPDDIQELCEKMVYYDGKEAKLEAAQQSMIRAVSTTITFME